MSYNNEIMIKLEGLGVYNTQMKKCLNVFINYKQSYSSILIYLKDLSEFIEQSRSKEEKTSIQTNDGQFVKEGQHLANKARSTKSILDKAKDWKMSVYLKKKLFSKVSFKQH